MVRIFLWHFFRFIFLRNCIMPHENILSVTDCRKNYENVFIWAHIKTIFHRNFCIYVSHSVKCSHMNQKWIAHFISLSMHTIWFGFYENMQIYAMNSNKCFWMGKQKTFPGSHHHWLNISTVNTSRKKIGKRSLWLFAFRLLFLVFPLPTHFRFNLGHWNLNEKCCKTDKNEWKQVELK